MKLREIAVRAQNIPQKYKHLKLLGKGWTSRVFEYDEDHVLIFTRDKIKEEWLRDGLNAQYIDAFDAYHPSRDIAEMPIYVYKVDKMYPLDKMNKKKVKLIVKKVDQLSHSRKMNPKLKHYSDFINQVIDLAKLEFADVTSFEDFVSFISNYDESQFNFDLSTRNLMQNKQGEIVFTDPIVSRDLWEAIHSYLKKLANNRRW